MDVWPQRGPLGCPVESIPRKPSSTRSCDGRLHYCVAGGQEGRPLSAPRRPPPVLLCVRWICPRRTFPLPPVAGAPQLPPRTLLQGQGVRAGDGVGLQLLGSLPSAAVFWLRFPLHQPIPRVPRCVRRPSAVGYLLQHGDAAVHQLRPRPPRCHQGERCEGGHRGQQEGPGTPAEAATAEQPAPGVIQPADLSRLPLLPSAVRGGPHNHLQLLRSAA
mmetsp:Transcript_7720/g.21979  ORF Transcript_7720/g.21979 Transcript_7720/m.21979 type:complete len:217 (-) Transcript_7720:782-1432(-)